MVHSLCDSLTLRKNKNQRSRPSVLKTGLKLELDSLPWSPLAVYLALVVQKKKKKKVRAVLNKTASELFIIPRLGICRSANWLNGAKNQQQTGKHMQHPRQGCLWALRRRHAKSLSVIRAVFLKCERRYEWFPSYGSGIGHWVGSGGGSDVRVLQRQCLCASAATLQQLQVDIVDTRSPLQPSLSPGYWFTSQ